MNYLVTARHGISLEGYDNVTSLKSLTRATSESVVVINSFEDEEYKASLAIIDLHRNRGVSKFIYISKTPIESIKLLIESIDGLYESDETLLSDVSEIEELQLVVADNIIEKENKGLREVSSGFDVLTDFIQKFESGDPTLNDPLYLEVVNRSLVDIRNRVKQQEERTELMGKSVVETYINTSNLVNELYKEAEELKTRLIEIEESTVVRKYGVVESLHYYPPVTYTGNIPLVVFKEVTACRYLTSFVLAYLNHLQTVLNKRVRLIFIITKQTSIKSKYKGYYELTKDNYRSGQAILNTISYTTTPLKSIMTHMTRQSDEVVLIVDRTYEKEPIVNGKAKVVYGVSSSSEITREKLDVKKCILPIKKLEGSLTTIQHINKYPSDKDSRLNIYERTFNEEFKKLDMLFNVVSM